MSAPRRADAQTDHVTVRLLPATSDSFAPCPAFAFPTPIGLGTDRIVGIDITRLVQYYLEHPEMNHGLIIGSLTGRRPGIFSLQERFGTGVRARIRYSYDLYKF